MARTTRYFLPVRISGVTSNGAASFDIFEEEVSSGGVELKELSAEAKEGAEPVTIAPASWAITMPAETSHGLWYFSRCE